MSLQLPDVVQTYFDISNGADSANLARCFAADAAVTDENKTHRGLEAIRHWKHEARQAFSYRVEPLQAQEEDGALVIAARVVGNFPGSPVQLKHRFTLADGRIQALEITL